MVSIGEKTPKRRFDPVGPGVCFGLHRPHRESMSGSNPTDGSANFTMAMSVWRVLHDIVFRGYTIRILSVPAHNRSLDS